MNTFEPGARTAAIVLAAGKGKRMGGDVRKQYMLLGGKPVLFHSLQCFEESFVDDIILVTGESDKEYCQKEIVEFYGFSKVKAIAAGGKERYHSVYEGLKVLGELWRKEKNGYVLIHDGARPFVNKKIIEDSVAAAIRYNACAVGMPVKDTIKIANAAGFAQMTPKRSDTWLIQTPQVFSCTLIRNAYDKLMSNESCQMEITDDAMVVETITKIPVKLVEGSYENIKVTTPEDMEIAEAILKRHSVY